MPDTTEQTEEDGTYDREEMKEFLAQDPAVAEMILRVMHSNAKETAWLGNQLAESYKARAERVEAELELIRYRIGRLLNADWAPSTIALERALWPSDEDVAAYMKDQRGSM